VKFDTCLSPSLASDKINESRGELWFAAFLVRILPDPWSVLAKRSAIVTVRREGAPRARRRDLRFVPGGAGH
jgi:hypothetical protein